MTQGYRTMNRRSAFTLTEILVVIAIIGILAALGTWGVFAMIGTQQRRNTENTMVVIKKMLDNRWAEVMREADGEEPSQFVMAMAGNDLARAKVIWRKVRLAEAFPTTYAEIQNPTVLSGYILPDRKFKSHFTKYQTTVTGMAGGTPGESAACLMLALQTLQGSDVNMVDQLKHAVVNQDGPTSPNKIPTLVDGWGKPLQFFRFAPGEGSPSGTSFPNYMPGQRYFFGNGVIVNNVRYVCIKDHNPPPPPRPPATSPTFWQPISQAVNPVATGAAGSKNADVKFADGVDKEGTLLNRTWFLPPPPPPPPPPATLPRVIFENQICLISPNNGGNAYYIVPIIVSSGKDGKMGLNAYCGPVSTDATDNIYSFKLRGQ